MYKDFLDKIRHVRYLILSKYYKIDKFVFGSGLFYFLVHSLKLITGVTNSLKEIDQEKIAIIVFQGCKSIYEEATN